MGLFNPRAFFLSDVNLLFQLTILLVLTVSILLRFRHRYSAHGAMMGPAVVLHSILIFAIMVPSLLGITPVFGNLATSSVLAVVSHAFLGGIVEVLGLYLVMSWALRSWNPKTCPKNKRLMIGTLIMWLIELVLGVLVYLLLYPPF
jgi:uncharacterized membrane protein YozB (DUF420 family)